LIKQLIISKDTNLSELSCLIKEYQKKYTQSLVTFEPLCSTRTKKQNALYQVLIKRLVAQSGGTEEFVKSIVKTEACGFGYPYERDNNGELVCDETGSPIPLSSSKASESEMKILIESCYRIAYEYGFILDDKKD